MRKSSILRLRKGLLRELKGKRSNGNLARQYEVNKLPSRETLAVDGQTFCGPDFLCAVHLLMMAV